MHDADKKITSLQLLLLPEQKSVYRAGRALSSTSTLCHILHWPLCVPNSLMISKVRHQVYFEASRQQDRNTVYYSQQCTTGSMQGRCSLVFCWQSAMTPSSPLLQAPFHESSKSDSRTCVPRCPPEDTIMETSSVVAFKTFAIISFAVECICSLIIFYTWAKAKQL